MYICIYTYIYISYKQPGKRPKNYRVSTAQKSWEHGNVIPGGNQPPGVAPGAEVVMPGRHRGSTPKWLEGSPSWTTVSSSRVKN